MFVSRWIRVLFRNAFKTASVILCFFCFVLYGNNYFVATRTNLSWTVAPPQGPGAGWGFNELNQEVRHHQGGWGHSLDHPPCSDKSQNSGFLRKSIFLILGAPQKLFWPPETLFGLRNLTFGGVILLKLFDSSFGFGATGGKIAIFWHNQPW